MKRDMEVIRDVLLAIEDTNQTQGIIELELPALDPVVVSYHIKLLADAGLIEADDLSTMQGFEWKPRSLTWAGHEFLDAARDDTVWAKVTAKLKDTVTSAPFEVVKSMVLQASKEAFGLS